MRLFVALDLSEEAQEHLSSVQTQIPTKDSRIKFSNNFHVTLKFLGDIYLHEIDKIKESLSNISFEPFRMELTEIGMFRKRRMPRIVYAGTDPLEPILELKKKIDASLLSSEKKIMRPHVTLGRIKHLKNPEEFMTDVKDITIKNISMKIDSFSLYQSTLTPQGPIYSVIQRFRA